MVVHGLGHDVGNQRSALHYGRSGFMASGVDTGYDLFGHWLDTPLVLWLEADGSWLKIEAHGVGIDSFGLVIPFAQTHPDETETFI